MEVIYTLQNCKAAPEAEVKKIPVAEMKFGCPKLTAPFQGEVVGKGESVGVRCSERCCHRRDLNVPVEIVKAVTGCVVRAPQIIRAHKDDRLEEKNLKDNPLFKPSN